MSSQRKMLSYLKNSREWAPTLPLILLATSSEGERDFWTCAQIYQDATGLLWCAYAEACSITDCLCTLAPDVATFTVLEYAFRWFNDDHRDWLRAEFQKRLENDLEGTLEQQDQP